ncbi:MAG TPA: hypothetical protein VEX67_06445 [Solirubrobacteraceae bacterium]|nr:hypothetical protein [Solirubrobacteraceae bacterium]
MDDLPPDLSRLGTELSTAIDNSLQRRRIVRALANRIATIGGVGALLFVGITAAPLHPGDVMGVAPAALTLRALPAPGNKSEAVRLRCDLPEHGSNATGCVEIRRPMAAWEPEQLSG